MYFAADGSLRLRRGALLDITIPAQRIADSRVERRFASGKAAAVDADGCAVLPMGGQTTVVVELDEPVEFVRPLGGRPRPAASATTPRTRPRRWPPCDRLRPGPAALTRSP